MILKNVKEINNWDYTAAKLAFWVLGAIIYEWQPINSLKKETETGKTI